jgi:hypothetical protein
MHHYLDVPPAGVTRDASTEDTLIGRQVGTEKRDQLMEKLLWRLGHPFIQRGVDRPSVGPGVGGRTAKENKRIGSRYKRLCQPAHIYIGESALAFVLPEYLEQAGVLRLVCGVQHMVADTPCPSARSAERWRIVAYA